MATVPKTVKTYNLNGSLKDFSVNFEYLARKFVVVTLLGATRKELVIGVDYRFTTPSQITTTVAEGPGTGYDLIEIRRVTSATDRLVDFADGSILRAYDLNTSQIQSLHIAEEARDLTADVIAINAEGQLDARGKKIQNLSDGTEPGDAVTLRQNQTWAQSTLSNRNAAEAAANLAVASRDTASNAQSIATTQAGIATVKASESEASAVRSETAAGTIGNNVALSQAARTGAEAARDVTVSAAQSVQGAGIPSAVGHALKFLRQNASESGLEYVDILDLLTDPWSFQPIGVPIPVLTNLGSLAPPTNKLYRYIKLTAGDSYNSGVVTGEVVTGTGALIGSTGVISLAGSPINGATVRLINTESRVLRASTVAGEALQDAIQNIVGFGGSSVSYGYSGAFYGGAGRGGVGAGGSTLQDAMFDASRVVRTSTTETRVKSQGVTYYMRIK